MDPDSYPPPDPSSSPLLVLLNIVRFGATQPEITLLIVSICIFLVLLALSGLISAAETAFFSLSQEEVNELQAMRSARSQAAHYLVSHPKILLGTILVSNTLVNVGAIMVASTAAHAVFDMQAAGILGLIVEVAVIALLIVLCGEVMPKIYASQSSMRIAQMMARPILFMRWFFQPVIYLLVRSTAIIDKRITRKGHVVSIDELNRAIDITSDKHAAQDEKSILKRIVNFGNIPVKQIMRSRVDVVACDSELPMSRVLALINEWGYSRVPVFEENIDKITGILYIKDLLPHLNQKDFNWHEVIKPAFFVPENKKINDLLREFQEKRIHMAVVVDEYGGTSGIVTMEDILEEIFGEINDEFDVDEVTYSQLDNRNFVFEGKILINDLCRIVGVDADEFDEIRGESDTLAGLVLELTGKIPNRGQRISYKDYTFVVESVDKRRIKRIKLTLPEPQQHQAQ